MISGNDLITKSNNCYYQYSDVCSTTNAEEAGIWNDSMKACRPSESNTKNRCSFMETGMPKVGSQEILNEERKFVHRSTKMKRGKRLTELCQESSTGHSKMPSSATTQ